MDVRKNIAILELIKGVMSMAYKGAAKVERKVHNYAVVDMRANNPKLIFN